MKVTEKEELSKELMPILINQNSSFVITDIKGPINEKLLDMCAKNGYQVKVLNLSMGDKK